MCVSLGIQHVCFIRGLGLGITAVFFFVKGFAQNQNRIRRDHSRIQCLRPTLLEYGDVTTHP